METLRMRPRAHTSARCPRGEDPWRQELRAAAHKRTNSHRAAIPPFSYFCSHKRSMLWHLANIFWPEFLPDIPPTREPWAGFVRAAMHS